MACDSHTTVPSSSITGTRRFGIHRAEFVVSSPPKEPPASICSCVSSSSPITHRTFCTLMEFRRPQTFNMVRPLQASALGEQERFAVVDHATIDAHPTDFTGEPAIFDLGTAIHHREAGLARHRGCLLIDDAKLHPDRLYAETILLAERFSHDAGRGIRPRKISTMSTGAGTSFSVR